MIWRLMIGLSMHNELESMLWEAIVAYLGYCPGKCLAKYESRKKPQQI
jgi:hypothetical protein